MKGIKMREPIEFGNTVRDILLRQDLEEEALERKKADERIVADFNGVYGNRLEFEHDAETGKLTIRLYSKDGRLLSEEAVDLDDEKIKPLIEALDAEIARATEAEGELSDRLDATESDCEALNAEKASKEELREKAEELESAISDETGRAEGEEARIEGYIESVKSDLEADIAIANTDIATEASKAREEEGKLSGEIAGEKAAREAKEAEYEGRIEALEAADIEDEADIALLKDGKANKADVYDKEAVDAEVDALSDRIDSVEEGKADKTHNHDDAYAAKAATETAISGLSSKMELAEESISQLTDEQVKLKEGKADLDEDGKVKAEQLPFNSARDIGDSDSAYRASYGAQNAKDIADLKISKQTVITDLDAIRSGAEAGSTAVQPKDL